MSYEVELKFPVPDPAAFEAQLADLGALEQATVLQADHYFRHPARDFGQTDEAFRIRCVGDRNWLTYKGPKLDTQTKTRREIELPFGDSAASVNEMREMLHLLGFRSALSVSKQRRQFELIWQDSTVEATLDQVEGLGTFAELEIVTDQAGLDAARERVLSLAEHCHLGRQERRSYLEMLLERHDTSSE